MNKTKTLSLVFLVLSVGLASYLVYTIYDSISYEKKIAAMEDKVIDKLMLIREAQEGYQAVNGQYTSDWSKLNQFVGEGQFYLTSRKERIFDLGYGRDSVVVEIDTLGTVLVKDSLFSEQKHPGLDISTLADVPGKEGSQFKMWAAKIQKAGVDVDVVEVWNPTPIDPNRKEDSESRLKKPLRFGSRTNITVAGNWE